jgi:lipopolysaccharide heptosyltransferase I
VLRSKQFSRILLIKPSALGDVVHALPVLVKLRKRYPAARIDWLITPENADLVRCHPALSNVVSFARRDYASFGRSWKGTTGVFKLLHTLWHNQYDLVIDLHGQFRSALFTLATVARVRLGFARSVERIGKIGKEQTPRHGWSGAREGAWIAYSHRIPIPTLDVHAIDRYLWLAPILGFDDAPPDLSIHLPLEAEKGANRLLKNHGLRDDKLAIVVPGTIWQTKHWTVGGFAQVGEYLCANGFSVLLVGTSRDRPRCEMIHAACSRSCDLSGQTSLAELAALLRKAAICVTNDSGPMHLAVALGKPVVSVFGPTNPVWVGPYGRAEAVVRADLPCSGCYLRKLRQCPYDHACMKQLSATTVIERVENILAGRSRYNSLAG